MFSSFFKNTVWLLVDKVYRIFAGLFVGSLVARTLGPENYGELNFYLAIIGTLSVIVSFGFKDVIIKHIKEYDNSENIIVYSLFFSIFLSIILIVFVLFISSNNILYILLALLFFKPYEILSYALEAESNFKQNVKFLLLASVCVTFFRLYGIFFQKGLSFFAFSYSLELIITALLLLNYNYKSLREVKVPSLGVLWRELKPVLSQSFGVLLVLLTGSLYMRIDQIMIGSLLSKAELGHYSVAVRLSELLYFVPISVISAFYPKLIEASVKGYAQRYDSFVWIGGIIVKINLFYILFIMFLGEMAIRLLFGDAFEPASNLLRIHSWSFILASFGMLSNKWYLFNSSTRLLFYNSIVGLSLNIALNFLLIGTYGAVAAAYVTIFSLLVSNLFMDLVWRQINGLFIIKILSIKNLFKWKMQI